MALRGGEKYWVWLDERAQGPFNSYFLMKMAKVEPPSEDFPDGEPGEINRETLFWSETLQEWIPMKEFPNEQYRADDNRDVIAEKRKHGVTHVAYLCAGNGKDCPQCLTHHEQVWPIDEAPRIPLHDCTCSPWPLGMWIAAPRQKPTAGAPVSEPQRLGVSVVNTNERIILVRPHKKGMWEVYENDRCRPIHTSRENAISYARQRGYAPVHVLDEAGNLVERYERGAGHFVGWAGSGSA